MYQTDSRGVAEEELVERINGFGNIAVVFRPGNESKGWVTDASGYEDEGIDHGRLGCLGGSMGWLLGTDCKKQQHKKRTARFIITPPNGTKSEGLIVTFVTPVIA